MDAEENSALQSLLVLWVSAPRCITASRNTYLLPQTGLRPATTTKRVASVPRAIAELFRLFKEKIG